MAKNSSTAPGNAAPADAGDPNQRQPEARHDGVDGTIPVAGPSVADRDNVDAQKLIDTANDGAKVEGIDLEPRSEPIGETGDGGEKRSLKTAGAYMILDPTTGVEITDEAREVTFSPFLQAQLDRGLIVEG